MKKIKLLVEIISILLLVFGFIYYSYIGFTFAVEGSRNNVPVYLIIDMVILNGILPIITLYYFVIHGIIKKGSDCK